MGWLASYQHLQYAFRASNNSHLYANPLGYSWLAHRFLHALLRGFRNYPYAFNSRLLLDTMFDILGNAFRQLVAALVFSFGEAQKLFEFAILVNGFVVYEQFHRFVDFLAVCNLERQVLLLSVQAQANHVVVVCRCKNALPIPCRHRLEKVSLINNSEWW